MKRLILTSLLVIILLGLGLYAYRSFYQPPKLEEIVVKKGEIVQQVNVTGQIKPAQSVDLAFEKSGTVAFVYAHIGDQVEQNQVLVSLVSSDLVAQRGEAEASVERARAGLKQYQAALAVSQAKINELLQGARPEELAIARGVVTSAEVNLQNVKNKNDIDLTNLYSQIKNVLNDAYTKADDAVTKQTEGMFSDENSPSPKLTFVVANAQVQVDVEWGRFVAGENLKSLGAAINTLSLDQAALDQALDKTQAILNSLSGFLNRLNDALNAQVNLSQTILIAYRGSITTARTNINAALSNVKSQKQAIAVQKVLNQNALASAEASLDDAKNQLALKKAGSTVQSISAQQGVIDQAQANIASQEAHIRQTIANVQNIEAQLAKTVIRSPLSGLVTKQEAKEGQIVPANSTVVSVIAQASLEIEANIPEVDVGKVMVGDSVRILIDALSQETFTGNMTSIDPAPTVIDGVTNFKVRVAFTRGDPRFKSGLTVNLAIQTRKKSDVLLLPQIAILENDKGIFVEKLEGKEVKELPITIGIRGENGNVEITSGLVVGDRVLNVGSKDAAKK